MQIMAKCYGTSTEAYLPMEYQNKEIVSIR